MAPNKTVLKYFSNFIGKSVYRNLFSNTPATLWKKRLPHSSFPLSFAKCLKAPFLQNTPGRLLLSIAITCQKHLELNVKKKWEQWEKKIWSLTSLHFNNLNLYVKEHTSIYQTTRACKNKAKPDNSYQIAKPKSYNFRYLTTRSFRKHVWS